MSDKTRVPPLPRNRSAAVMEVWLIGLGFALVLYGAGYIWRNHDD